MDIMPWPSHKGCLGQREVAYFILI
jgi:hypothetical protein